MSTYQQENSFYRYLRYPELFQAPPPVSDPEQLPSAPAFEAATFDVKYLGSGVVQHCTDYGGCLRLLEERKRRRQRRKYKKRFEITVNPQCFYAVDKITKEWALVRKLEEMHVVCPHPSSSRLVGVVAENRGSGTIHCYCFLTKRGSTGTQVLSAFRKACCQWLANNSRKPSMPLRLNQTGTLPEDQVKEEIPGSSNSISCSSITEENTFHSHSKTKCVKQAVPVSARQVSFAPVVRCYQSPSKEIIEIPLEESVKSAIFASTSNCRVKKLRSKIKIPCLPPKKFPPPLPPCASKPCAHRQYTPLQSSNSWFELNIPYLPPRRFPPPPPPHTDKPSVQRSPCAHRQCRWHQSSNSWFELNIPYLPPRRFPPPPPPHQHPDKPCVHHLLSPSPSSISKHTRHAQPSPHKLHGCPLHRVKPYHTIHHEKAL